MIASSRGLLFEVKQKDKDGLPYKFVSAEKTRPLVQLIGKKKCPIFALKKKKTTRLSGH